jgi:Holliday junction resolvase RusA-like endonuclease
MEKKELILNLLHKGEPKPYARQRFTFKGKHSYNPNGEYMIELREKFNSQISKEDKELIKYIIEHQDKKDNDYYVEVEGKFYITPPASDSNKLRNKKLSGEYRPTVARGDVDNYIKLILDTLQDVVYDDDRHVIKVVSEKYYAEEPKVELLIKIKYSEVIRNEKEKH